MRIAILDPIRIDGEPVAAVSLEGTSPPGGWQVGRPLRAPNRQNGSVMPSGSTLSFGYEVEAPDGEGLS